MPYEKIGASIQEWLEEIVREDDYGLRAETLYYNILNSTGTDEKLSEIFAVPLRLVQAIKES
jgi:hypothetical protein